MTGVPALGVIPGGATNVFARALGLPNDPVEVDRHPARCAPRRAAAGRSAWAGPTNAGSSSPPASGSMPRSSPGSTAMRGRGRRSSELLFARAGVRRVLRDRPPPSAPAARPWPTAPTLDRLHYVVVTNTDPWTYIGTPGAAPHPAGILRHRARRLRPHPDGHHPACSGQWLRSPEQAPKPAPDWARSSVTISSEFDLPPTISRCRFRSTASSSDDAQEGALPRANPHAVNVLVSPRSVVISATLNIVLSPRFSRA